MQDGAVIASDFADEHPTLAKFGLTAVQLALAGPVGFAREQILDVVGVTDAIDDVATKAERHFSQNLQDRLGFTERKANFTASGARFGAAIGLGFIGATSKDKIIDAAHQVKEKVMGNSKKYGRSLETGKLELKGKEVMNEKGGSSSNSGRAGKQKRLKELAHDLKLGSADRGWLKQEINEVKRGKKAYLRNPPGKELAHKRGYEAAKGFDYSHTNLQEKNLHKLQHKYDNNGKKNKTPNQSGNLEE